MIVITLLAICALVVVNSIREPNTHPKTSTRKPVPHTQTQSIPEKQPIPGRFTGYQTNEISKNGNVTTYELTCYYRVSEEPDDVQTLDRGKVTASNDTEYIALAQKCL